MIPETHREFNSALWERNRMERAERMEIKSAMQLVNEGQIERYAKPGSWRVFQKNGHAIFENLTPTA